MCLALVIALHTVKVIWSINVIVGLKFLLCGTIDLVKVQISSGFCRPLLVTLLPLLIECRLFDVARVISIHAQ